jgi:hypothetical protein
LSVKATRLIELVKGAIDEYRGCVGRGK